jgi:hypothetical protein
LQEAFLLLVPIQLHFLNRRGIAIACLERGISPQQMGSEAPIEVQCLIIVFEAANVNKLLTTWCFT